VNRRHAAVIGGIAIAAIGVTIFLYYYFMSAWIYVDVTTEIAGIVQPTSLSDADIARHPVLQQKIHEANEHWANPETIYGPTRATFFEGKVIENLAGSSGKNLTGNNEVYFHYDDRDYRLIIVYRY
jgi:hypothetical protein